MATDRVSGHAESDLTDRNAIGQGSVFRMPHGAPTRRFAVPDDDAWRNGDTAQRGSDNETQNAATYQDRLPERPGPRPYRRA